MRKMYALLALMFSGGIAIAQENSYVPQVREGVEWGYSRSSVVPGGTIDYFRLQFDGTTVINDKEYSNLYMYGTYFLFTEAKSPVAWMREEDKKVYAILNPEFEDLAGMHGCVAFEGANGSEVLLMDYGVSPDESFSVGNPGNGLTAVCTAKETVTIGDTQRQMFTIDMTQSSYGSYGTFKVVEGVGPVSYDFPGAGSFLFPFCMPLDGIGFPTQYDGWLYEREVLPVDTSYGDPDLYIYTMGRITSTSPIFDYCGVHDPTVWYWMDRQKTISSVTAPTETDDIEMSTDNGTVTVTSYSSAITNVQLFRPDGSLLKSVRPADGIVTFSFPEYAGKMLIAVTNLANGKKAVRKLVSR